MHNSLLIVDTHVPLCTPIHVSINVDTKHHCNVTTDIGSYEVCVRNEKNIWSQIHCDFVMILSIMDKRIAKPWRLHFFLLRNYITLMRCGRLELSLFGACATYGHKCANVCIVRKHVRVYPPCTLSLHTFQWNKIVTGHCDTSMVQNVCLSINATTRHAVPIWLGGFLYLPNSSTTSCRHLSAVGQTLASTQLNCSWTCNFCGFFLPKLVPLDAKCGCCFHFIFNPVIVRTLFLQRTFLYLQRR